MKYVIYGEWKGPYEETLKKALEIEKGRKERGETFDQTGEMIGQYFFLDGRKVFQIIETDDVSRIAKWTQAYGSLCKTLKVIPVLTRKETEAMM